MPVYHLKKKKLKLGKSSRHMSSFFNARMLSCVTVWLPNVFRKGFCAVLWPPPPHHHHKLWNTYYMELKHLTDYELYRGLQLFPVQAAGVYPIVWSCPDRVYTCFCRSILCVIPTGFYIQPDRDYFHTIYYPDRVYSSVWKWAHQCAGTEHLWWNKGWPVICVWPM